MECKEIIFSSHALQRMFERSISPLDVRAVVISGEIIVEYPEDTPHPSYLTLGFVNDRPIHAVVAREKNSQRCYVITAYIPDPTLWSTDFSTRRSS